MSGQKKLESWQIEHVRDATKSITRMCWHRTPQGYAFWGDALGTLCRVVEHGTSDGKPYVEPVRIPTDEDAKSRPMVMVRGCEDEDWVGEMMLLRVKPSSDQRFIVERTIGFCDVSEWKYCRFPTEAELKEMGQ